MRDLVIHYAELALITSVTGRGVESTAPGTELHDLFKQAFKIGFEEMAIRTYSLTDADINIAGGLFEEWANATGWGDKARHDCTRVSFALRIMENSEHTYSYRLAEILMKIIDHYEQGNKMPAASCWSGDLAGEKWERMINDIQAGKRPVPIAITIEPKFIQQRLPAWQLTLLEAQGAS